MKKSDDDDDEENDKQTEAYSKFIAYVMKTLIIANTTNIPEDFDERIEIAVQVIVQFQSEINKVSSKSFDFFLAVFDSNK